MDNAAAIRATYADWKLVKTRGVVQIVFEVPLHEADNAYQVVGGMPDAAKERWFGIARLVENGSAQPTAQPSRGAADGVARHPEAASRPFNELPLPQQCGILCNEPAFQRFLHHNFSGAWYDSKRLDPLFPARSCVRHLCNVTSRADIQDNTEAGDLWKELVNQYRAWMKAPEVVA